MQGWGQDSLADTATIDLPGNYINSVENKIKNLDDNLSKQTDKYLNSLSRQESEINYMADALLLSDRVSFANEDISDNIGYLTDPEINGRLTKNAVRGVLTFCQIP